MRLSRSSAGETVLVAACRYSSAPDPGEVLTDLFVVHSRALVGLARLLVDDQATAEDVVQDAFVATFSRWSNIRDPEAALPYLRSAVINHARKSLRSRQHGGRVSLPQPGEPEYPGPGTDAVERGNVASPPCGRCPTGSGRSWCCATTSISLRVRLLTSWE